MQQKHWMNLRASVSLHTHPWPNVTSTSEYLRAYTHKFIHTQAQYRLKEKTRVQFKWQTKSASEKFAFISFFPTIDSCGRNHWRCLASNNIVVVAIAVGIVIVIAIILTAAVAATNLARLSLNTIVTIAVTVTGTVTGTVTAIVTGAECTLHMPPLNWWPIFGGTSAADSSTKTICNCRHSTVSSNNNNSGNNNHHTHTAMKQWLCDGCKRCHKRNQNNNPPPRSTAAPTTNEYHLFAIRVDVAALT